MLNSKHIYSQSSQYAYFVEKLPPEVTIEVSDLLDEMPTDKAYDTLKEAILQRYVLTREIG